MSYSKIDICNQALTGILGEDLIRSFDDNNKNARMASLSFDFLRDRLLADFDWAFARKLVKLESLVLDTPIPSGEYVYGLPADCIIVRDLYPHGSREYWQVLNGVFYCKKSGSVYIYYTAKEEDTRKYSQVFCDLLAVHIAARICVPVTHDRKLKAVLAEEARIAKLEAYQVEANANNAYRDPDNDPDNDTFVDPDKKIASVSDDPTVGT